VIGPERLAPAQWAEQAAEAVRRLNHATITIAAEGYRVPGDVDATLANLQVLVERLPQALEQMTRWLERQARAGLVRHDAVPVDLGRAVAAQQGLVAVLELTEDLDTAAVWLAAVAAPLGRARSHSSRLAAFVEDLPDDPDHEDDGDRLEGDGAR
jgi:predicted TPR repeat methyltransferase